MAMFSAGGSQVCFDNNATIVAMNTMQLTICDPCYQNESECIQANFELQAKRVKNVNFD